MTKTRVLRAFHDKIELKMPMDAYFHIGINGQVDFENSENMYLEKVFSFYSQLKSPDYVASSKGEPDKNLTLKQEANFDGLEFL